MDLQAVQAIGTRLLRERRVVGAVRLATVLVAVAASSTMLIARSDAAFTARTENPANALHTAQVSLSDNDGGAAMFSVADMIPDQTEQRCVKVSYTGSLTAAKLTPVRLHVADAGDLGPYLLTAVEMGTAGSEAFDPSTTAASCSGFGGTITPLHGDPTTMPAGDHLAALVSAHGTYPTGLDTTWTPSASGDARWFRVTFRVADDDQAQNRSAAPVFTWELHSQ